MTCHSEEVVTQNPARPIPTKLFGEVKFKVGPIIPGLKQGYVPQGFAYLNDESLFCISHYSDKKSPSIVTFIDFKSEKLLSYKSLRISKDEFLTGHVGGVALSSEDIFVASGGKVYQYKNSEASSLLPKAIYDSETNASFCTYSGGMLFVGEFVYGSMYKSKSSHHVKDRKGLKKYALICGYTKGNFKEPAFAISIRQQVQGMAYRDKDILLSVSYGRGNASKIARYHNPLKEKAHDKIVLNGKSIPLWFLDGENHIQTISFPPMSQGVVNIGDNIAVLTESGATKYLKGGKGPIDHIIYISR